jgi:type I restriction enzyme S subunit
MGYRRHFKFLRDASFSLPPLLEQKRIVQKLSSMLGKLKEARELIQEARDTFEERRAAILNKAFTGELTKKWREENPDAESAEKLIEILITEKKKQRKEGKKEKIPTYEEMIVEDGAQPYNLPGNWEWVKIGYLLCEVAKKDPKREGIKKFTYLDISSIDNKAGRITDPKTYKGVEAPSRARQIVKTHDILFSTVRTYLKNIAVVDEIYNDQIASTGFCVMRCCGIINSRLLFRFVSSDVFIDRLNGFQRGISYPAVKTSDLLKQPIPLPPLPEQKEIMRILDKLLNHEDEAKALIDMEEQIDLIEKSILSKAFSGELGTNDPNDEPAIELLKRSLKEKMNK